MHLLQRIICAALLVVLTSLIAGCSSLDVPSWDPTDLLDFLDTKKKAPGERHPVFPDGVPGVTQGVPPELMKGTPEHQAAMAASDPTLAPPPAEQPPVEAAKPKPKAKKHVASRPTRLTVTPNQPAGDQTGSADTEMPPAAPPPRKRAAGTAAAASDQGDQQTAAPPQQQGRFAAPVPSGSFQR